MRWLVLLVTVVVGGGCGGVQPPPTTARLELGTVASDGTGFLPLTGDQPLISGAQGGFHVWLKYRVIGMAAETVTVHREARRVMDHRLVLTTDGVQDVGAPDANGAWELPQALPSFMCPSPIGVQVMDEAILFDVEMKLEDGNTIKANAEATPHCPPVGDPQHDFCIRICAG